VKVDADKVHRRAPGLGKQRNWKYTSSFPHAQSLATRRVDLPPSHSFNLHAQAHSISRQDGHKDFRIDTPHLDRNAGGIGITGKGTIHPAIRRLQTGRDSTLLDLSSIFGK
jgi:hypothetical protein